MHNRFDEKTQAAIGFYVYILIDPETKQPFYVGKGTGNRVFDHIAGSIGMMNPINMKYEKILALRYKNLSPEHVIVRHGLSETTAFEIESALIDTLRFLGAEVTNIVDGHDADERGLMTVDEIVRKNHADPLDAIDTNCVIINISRKYERGFDSEKIYQAAKKAWVISKSRLGSLRYVLVEYRGLIVEVFEVNDWHEEPTQYASSTDAIKRVRTRYGFNGTVARDEIRSQYINKTIAHHKKRGQASPVRYRL